MRALPPDIILVAAWLTLTNWAPPLCTVLYKFTISILIAKRAVDYSLRKNRDFYNSCLQYALLNHALSAVRLHLCVLMIGTHIPTLWNPYIPINIGISNNICVSILNRAAALIIDNYSLLQCSSNIYIDNLNSMMFTKYHYTTFLNFKSLFSLSFNYFRLIFIIYVICIYFCVYAL